MQKTSLYILDCLFSVLIVGTLVVFVWRGAWVLIDIYLFPENEAWSAWASLVSVQIIIITLTTQSLNKLVQARIHARICIVIKLVTTRHCQPLYCNIIRAHATDFFYCLYYVKITVKR